MSKKIPEEIKDFLYYDEIAGTLFWIKSPSNRVFVNSIAGSPTSSGHLSTMFKGSNYKNHRIAWFLKTGKQPPNKIDHYDENGTNNKWDNLREATTSENGCNRGKNKSNTSGFKGVTWNKKASKWLAQLKVNNKLIYIGLFTDPKEAHTAYCKYADEYHREFANYGTN